MLIAAYQSSFFNEWLANRIKSNEEDFKLFDGDIFNEFKREKLFTPKKITDQILKDFQNQKVSPTGLLLMTKSILIQEKGYRREAIVFPKDITCKYNSADKTCTLEFSLPKGSYATVLIEKLGNKNLN